MTLIIKNSLLYFVVTFLFILGACKKDPGRLPYLGNVKIEGKDTLYHKIPDFTFINQDSALVTPSTFKDKVYLADFFFTSCPSICPKVKKNMLRVYDKYESHPDVLMISHSIDTYRDTVLTLRTYANNLNVTSAKWHFVTGVKEEIYDIADDYFVSAMEDPSAPGGFDHSGRIILVDKEGHIRSYANGTDAEEVDRLMIDVDRLLDEYAQ